MSLNAIEFAIRNVEENMNKIQKFTYLTILLSLFYNLSNKTFGQTLTSKIDNLIDSAFQNANEPGGVFLVAKDGKTIYKRAFGKANLELDVDMNVEDVFELGSMTKQFTAIAILMLEEQEKLDIHDSISKYLPDYPNGNKITIYHLLTHTSGIKDFTMMKSLRDIAQKEMTPKMMVNFFKNEPFDFLPGEKFEYNNSGYVILGYIIEAVSGDSYKDYIEKHIFQKVGMTQSRYASNKMIVKHRAYGYQKKGNVYLNKTVINFSVPFSSGSLMSTVDNMLMWQNALTNNLLLKPETIKNAFKKNQLNNGEKFSYGYGWHIKEVDGGSCKSAWWQYFRF